MSDRGIIFSGPMVRALLAGQKTQTRRLLYTRSVRGPNEAVPKNACMDRRYPPPFSTVPGEIYSLSPTRKIGPGDRLYVRECAQEVGDGYLTIYRADYPDCVPARFENVPTLEELKTPWRPSIHMPRKWSRLWLQVFEVRIQRLQEITETDAIAEGIPYDYGEHIHGPGGYRALWESLHDAPGSRWNDDPWVIALSFSVHKGNIDA